MSFHWELNERMYSSEPLLRCQLHNCKAACCLYGTWVGLEERENILAHKADIQKHLDVDNQDWERWFQEKPEPDSNFASGTVYHTTVITSEDHYGKSACIFLQKDYKCGLQVASCDLGDDPWMLKPFYCILHPLDIDGQGKITLDDAGLLLEEEGSCLVYSAISVPLLETFEQELLYLLGSENYKQALQLTRGI